jgi:hypothetical protein
MPIPNSRPQYQHQNGLLSIELYSCKTYPTKYNIRLQEFAWQYGGARRIVRPSPHGIKAFLVSRVLTSSLPLPPLRSVVDNLGSDGKQGT